MNLNKYINFLSNDKIHCRFCNDSLFFIASLHKDYIAYDRKIKINEKNNLFTVDLENNSLSCNKEYSFSYLEIRCSCSNIRGSINNNLFQDYIYEIKINEFLFFSVFSINKTIIFKSNNGYYNLLYELPFVHLYDLEKLKENIIFL